MKMKSDMLKTWEEVNESSKVVKGTADHKETIEALSRNDARKRIKRYTEARKSKCVIHSVKDKGIMYQLKQGVKPENIQPRLYEVEYSVISDYMK